MTLAYEPQHPGTIVIINTQTIHHAIPDKRITTSNEIRCWIGTTIGYAKKPKCDEAEEDFGDFLNHKLNNI